MGATAAIKSDRRCGTCRRVVLRQWSVGMFDQPQLRAMDPVYNKCVLRRFAGGLGRSEIQMDDLWQSGQPEW